MLKMLFAKYYVLHIQIMPFEHNHHGPVIPHVVINFGSHWFQLMACCLNISKSPILHLSLRHWGWDKMATIFQMTFWNRFSWIEIYIFIQVSLKFVPRCPITNIPAFVPIMASRWPGDKPLSEPMMAYLLMHICITQPQWVNDTRGKD